MTCFSVLLLGLVILYVSTMLTLGLLSITLALIVIAIIIGLAFLLYFWRVIYPWLVRMGRWSSQLRNLVFLALVLSIGTLGLVIVLGTLGQPIPTAAVVILALLLFLLLLFLAIVVWLVRLWRYSWPPLRNVFWDMLFRAGALVWKILLGIPLGVVWFLYHPPLRWLVAVILFYFRGVAAATAWLLYNPPLRELIRAALFLARPVAWLVAVVLYNPPVRWLIEFAVFMLRLMARLVSTLLYGAWSWWPVMGVRDRFRTGLTVESKSYQDYKYAHNDGSPAA